MGDSKAPVSGCRIEVMASSDEKKKMRWTIRGPPGHRHWPVSLPEYEIWHDNRSAAWNFPRLWTFSDPQISLTRRTFLMVCPPASIAGASNGIPSRDAEGNW